ncbi:hypothetical protein RFI_12874, partial [Reticulomyxa filosa]
MNNDIMERHYRTDINQSMELIGKNLYDNCITSSQFSTIIHSTMKRIHTTPSVQLAPSNASQNNNNNNNNNNNRNHNTDTDNNNQSETAHSDIGGIVRMDCY